MPTIEQTRVIIRSEVRDDQLRQEERYARRNRITAIDALLEEFEQLNLAEEESAPADLLGRAQSLVVMESHPLAERHPREVSIADWMEALYDIQDTLMLPLDEGWD